jgi:hypothetical protein
MIGICVTLPASAATVEAVEGKPLYLSAGGQGYKKVTASTKVSTGDRVMAPAGGRGKIVYPDGCVVDVYPGAVVTVPGKCYQPMTAGLEAPPPAPFPWVPAVLGAGVVAVGICAVSGCFENGGGTRSHDGGHGHNDD